MIVLQSPEESLAFGAKLGAVLRTADVVALSGPLGAGKTLVTKGILMGLGYDGDVPSPSFPLMIPYEPPAVSVPLTHIDLYRIHDSAGLTELGLADARAESALVVEWPDHLVNEGWKDMLLLFFEIMSNTSRVLTAQVPPAWESRWPLR
jgi:tRNA threonylcarbamoyladenosine biosynthesis protein TsaE